KSVEVDELFRRLHRKGLVKDGVDETEDGGVRANSESQREHGNCSEAGILAQHARGVAQILKESFEPNAGADFADAFFHLFHAACFYTGRALSLFRIHSRV